MFHPPLTPIVEFTHVVGCAARLDPHFALVDPADVDDLLAMLAIVPFERLIHDTQMYLNPTFKASSRVVGGADADLFAGDLLVDFKTSKKGTVEARDLDQLFGYYVLASRQRQIDPTFPPIKRLGLYYARHGHLWIVDARIWTDHPEFPEVEPWFLAHAQDVFGKG